MDILKGINVLVRFLLELCMYAAVGYWGFTTHASLALKILLGIGLPVLLAVIWGMLLAPKAMHPLRGPWREVLEWAMFGAGAAALFAAGRQNLGWIYLVTLIINKVFLAVWKQ